MEVSHLGPTGAIVLRNADKEWSIDAAIATTRNRRTVDRPVRDLTNRPNHAMAGAAKVLISETVLCTCISLYSWLATMWEGGHVGGQHNRIFSRRIYMRLPEERNAFFLHHQHGSRHTYNPAIGVVVSNHTPILGTLDSFPVYPFLPFGIFKWKLLSSNQGLISLQNLCTALAFSRIDFFCTLNSFISLISASLPHTKTMPHNHIS